MPLHELHLYCQVVDNFGDAGVCWRLARQLAREHGLSVTLWIDQPPVLRRLVPELELAPPLSGRQPAPANPGLTVRAWPADAPPGPHAALPDVVVCAFGCEPPAWLRAQLAHAPPRPLWINLEYLSAEPWVEGCHGLASIKPADGAREHFFYPGWREATGGLLRERDLLASRDAFRRSSAAERWWQARGLDGLTGRRVSVFCYPQAPLQALLSAMAQSAEPTLALVSEGIGAAVIDALAAAWPTEETPAGPTLSRPSAGALAAARCGGSARLRRIGQLTLVPLPMLPIDDYDRLLWSCDLNFVRGEDSWVRALWAGRPLIWQPYRQTDDAHRVKLEAFLDWQREGLGGPATPGLAALEQLSRDWSAGIDPGPAWQSLQEPLAHLGTGFDRLAATQGSATDLASKLVEFCRSRL